MYAHTTILGRVGRKPELKTTSEGKQYVKISIALSAGHNNDATETTWYSGTVWGKSAENAAKYVDKGATILVSGRPSVRLYQGNDGQTKCEQCVNVVDWKVIRRPEHALADAGDAREKPFRVPTFDHALPDDFPF